MLAALNEAEDEIEEELSARAKGAAGGGLVLEVTGGLNGLGLKTKVIKMVKQSLCYQKRFLSIR